ncbi:ferritin family protein [Desulfococcus multivorans]|jgi:rubrerythrin|uniref:Rubrerythrin Rbr n=1 Tax=Desulfococcus multivorans DSM 2059 TaxID=1121405 RepID=S7U688_DESML|nr:ferritin family protein [Desulfococcus multivorans]AOY58872.1 Rbr4: rubrerythrin [Desulfococcus multivorans]AQV01155.1 rubrerythrin [Desulfococcus multivorans]EPR44842.1 rubrerythrin Rbr [Desulfococcus multivorans DSM 2059]MDX9819763.1 ferritin family protein [Desulfococcus multivorans]SJZ52234.1 Rubrerythrin [Desulfococcus multivorans DSM 2059]
MHFESINEIIDFAIQKEQEAVDFYLTASREESMSGSKEMLIEFSEEEKKHKRMLEELKVKGYAEGVEDYQFKWIKDIKRSDYMDDMVYKPGMGYRDILIVAIKREENALKLYNKLLAEAKSENAKAIFKILCQEEARHKLGLETLYDDHMAEMGD